ncbi:unnamed protein product [Toxocara canis]|uniref:Methyltransf_2 domain-containing protein n=1 Tax=Toxocara canis TaxID=6265 RepID=A0A183UY37_TOXCA|nr:unnamed protein product [Toxocara canis]
MLQSESGHLEGWNRSHVLLDVGVGIAAELPDGKLEAKASFCSMPKLHIIDDDAQSVAHDFMIHLTNK